MIPFSLRNNCQCLGRQSSSGSDKSGVCHPLTSRIGTNVLSFPASVSLFSNCVMIRGDLLGLVHLFDSRYAWKGRNALYGRFLGIVAVGRPA